MTVAELIRHLVQRGSRLEVTADGGIDYIGPKELLTAELRDQIRRNKPAIIAWLRTPIDDQPVADQLALDYERTVPDWLLERIHETWGRDTCGGTTTPREVQLRGPGDTR